MHYVLFDDEKERINLFPLTLTRPISELRIGILTIKEKWEKSLGVSCLYYTANSLTAKYPKSNPEKAIYINASICPDEQIIEAIKKLKETEGIKKENKLLAFCGNSDLIQDSSKLKISQHTSKLLTVENVWDIFQKNAEAIQRDFDLLTRNRKSLPLSSTVTVIGNPAHVFLCQGAKAEACILNVTNGPVYLGEDAEIMEGSVVRGPFALGDHSALKLSTKIYGATTIGPHCKVGGEVNNSVIFGYSNKAHDGFLGNSVLAEWCNLGADTNNSNLKNNYGNVKLYNYLQQKQSDTGLQFCGLIMGDHSKSGINTMFNTGTVVGVGCNIYGGGFPPTYIPNFSWGGSEGLEDYKLEKLFETAERVFERRGLKFDETEKEILTTISKNKS